MIPHKYVNGTDNVAQYYADTVHRQEVEFDWFIDNMPEAPLFRWLDGYHEHDLDPWRLYEDEPDPNEGVRLFVQRKDIPADLRESALTMLIDEYEAAIREGRSEDANDLALYVEREADRIGYKDHRRLLALHTAAERVGNVPHALVVLTDSFGIDRVVGPFDSADAASAWADGFLTGEPYMVTPLIACEPLEE